MATGGKKMKLRKYQPGDEAGILELFTETYGIKRSLAWWQWYYQANPAGKAIIWVAEADNKIIGHRALVPYRFWDGQTYSIACQATDAATDQNYRGQGIFTQLTKAVIKEAESKGWKFIFSFPNEQSLPGNQKLGWEPVKKLRKWVKPLLCFSKGGYNKSKEQNYLQTVLTVGEEFTLFWHKYGIAAAGIHKDGTYLKWRYQDKPGEKYDLLAVIKNNELQAFVVVRREANRGHLLEFMPGSLDPGNLLKKVEAYLCSCGIKFVTMWPPQDLPMHPLLLGYLPNPLRVGTLAIRPLSGKEVNTNWRVTPGDPDYA